jgi:hypothetical protein
MGGNADDFCLAAKGDARLNIYLGAGAAALIINATIGAIVLLILLRVLAGNRGWGGGWATAAGDGVGEDALSPAMHAVS